MIINKDESGGSMFVYSQVNYINDTLNKLEIVCCTYSLPQINKFHGHKLFLHTFLVTPLIHCL